MSRGIVTDVWDMAGDDGYPFAIMAKIGALFSVTSLIGW
jgi:hypothetical protein